MKLATFIKDDKSGASIAEKVQVKAKVLGFNIDMDDPDYVIFIGGDGTFLKCVHKYIDILDHVKFIGVHKGRVGFFFEYSENDIDVILNLLLSGEYKVTPYPLIKATYANKTVYAVNEVRIENPFRTLISDILISGTYLENFRGNGLVVSSAIGSSAYNKSLGGAIIDPSLPVLQLTEVAAIQNNMYHSLGSSLVLDSNEVITFKTDMDDLVIGYDNFTDVTKSSKEIVISLSDKKAYLIHGDKFSYFDKLNKTFIH